MEWSQWKAYLACKCKYLPINMIVASKKQFSIAYEQRHSLVDLFCFMTLYNDLANQHIAFSDLFVF